MGRTKGSKNGFRKDPKKKPVFLTAEVYDDEEEFSFTETLPVFDEKVLTAYREKNYHKCIELIERILINNTDDNKDHYKILQAGSYTMVGEDFPTAHSILDEVLMSDPTNVFAMYNKGVAYYFERRVEESVAMLNKAIVTNPREMQRAKAMKMRIDLERRKPIIMITKCNEEDFDMLQNSSEHVEGDREISSNSMDTCDLLLIKPEKNLLTHQACDELKKYSEESKNISLIENASKKVPHELQKITADENNAETLQSISESVSDEKNNKALQPIQSKSPVELFDEGEKLYKRGELQQALKLFSKALDADPNFTDADEMRMKAEEFLELKDIADINMAQKNYQAVVEINNEALEIDEENYHCNMKILNQRGSAYLKMGKTDESMRDYAESDRIKKIILSEK